MCGHPAFPCHPGGIALSPFYSCLPTDGADDVVRGDAEPGGSGGGGAGGRRRGQGPAEVCHQRAACRR